MTLSNPPLIEKPSPEAMNHNASILQFTRIYLSLLAGCVAGVLGLTGFWGFVFYFFSSFLASGIMLYRNQNKMNEFFPQKTQFFTMHLGQGALVSPNFCNYVRYSSTQSPH